MKRVNKYCKDCKWNLDAQSEFCYIMNEFTGVPEKESKKELNSDGGCIEYVPRAK
jgi:hypothetical protein